MGAYFEQIASPDVKKNKGMTETTYKFWSSLKVVHVSNLVMDAFETWSASLKVTDVSKARGVSF